MQFRRKRRAGVEIGLIPMIDVLLVLLFFFMVATTFRQQSALKVNLPQAAANDSDATLQAVNLLLDATGQYAIQDDKTQQKAQKLADLNALKSALQQLPADARQRPFVIRADGKAPHQAVISALDAANQLGFHHITFAIDAADKP
jgi:biopolymer transport protein ExbD